MYRTQVPALNLSLERGTDACPDAENFHVIHAGKVLYSSAREKDAQAFYARRRDELFEAQGGKPKRRRLTSEERVAKERAHRDIQALRVESFDRRTSNARKRGGKGGRGGV